MGLVCDINRFKNPYIAIELSVKQLFSKKARNVFVFHLRPNLKRQPETNQYVIFSVTCMHLCGLQLWRSALKACMYVQLASEG